MGHCFLWCTINVLMAVFIPAPLPHCPLRCFVLTKISLTHWVRVTHICVGKLTIIGSNNGLSPGRRQAIIWTYAGMLLISPLGTNFNEILIEIHTFSFKNIHLKMSSGKWPPFCLGLNVLIHMGVDREDMPTCYLDHAITPHCTIFPHRGALSRIAGPGGRMKCIFMQLR